MLRLPVLLLACAILLAQTPAPTTGKLDLSVGTRDRKPIAGARVIWTGPDKQRHEALTGEDGELRLSGLAPGVYGLKISAAGYSLAIAPATVAYVPGGNVAVVNAVMIPDGAIGGTVTDEDGKPIPGVMVVAAPANLGPSAQNIAGTAITGADGRYLIADRPPGGTARGGLTVGTWVAKVYLPIQRAIELGKGFKPAYSESFNLRPGVTQNVDFQLHSDATFHIRGRVTGGKPEAEGAFVLTQDCRPDADNDPGARAALSSDGSFGFSALLPGTYCLTLEAAQGTGLRLLSEAAVVTISDHDVESVQITPRP